MKNLCGSRNVKLVLGNKICCIHLFYGLDLAVPNELRLTGVPTETDSTKNCTLFFLGGFVKLRKATFSFVTSVLLYVRIKQLGSYRTDFHDVYICVTWLLLDGFS